MKRLLSLIVLGIAMVSAPVQAQEDQAQSAFAEYAQPLRFAAATHVLDLRLEARAALPGGAEAGGEEAGPEAEGGEEEEEGPPIPLLALFAGSLAAADPGLLEALETDLEDVNRLATAGDEGALRRTVADAQQKLARVREVLVPKDVAGEPAFRAALIAELAISERGLGEGYEEAAGGELAAYPVAWLTLQRVGALWSELEPDLEAASQGVEGALDALNGLMPSLEPPDTFRDPEDAEGAALDLVFALQGALGRPVSIRGFAPALDLTQQQADAACTAVEEGRGRLALENALAARITYDAHLGSTLATLAPDAHADLNELWGELDSLEAGQGAETCAALRDAIKRAGAALG